MPGFSDKDVLRKYDVLIKGQVGDKEAQLDSKTLAELQQLRALRDSAQAWRTRGQEEYKRLVSMAYRVAAAIKDTDPISTKAPVSSPTQPQQSALLSASDFVIRTATDRNSFHLDLFLKNYVDGFKNGMKSFGEVHEYARTKAATEGARYDQKLVKELNADGETVHNGINYNKPQTSSPFKENPGVSIGSGTEVLIIVGDRLAGYDDAYLHRKSLQLANELRKTGAKVEVLASPTRETLDKKLSEIKERLKNGVSANFSVSVIGHGRANTISNNKHASWAENNDGVIGIRNADFHKNSVFNLKESEFVDQLTGMQLETGKRGELNVVSCRSGAWLSKPPATYIHTAVAKD